MTDLHNCAIWNGITFAFWLGGLGIGLLSRSFALCFLFVLGLFCDARFLFSFALFTNLSPLLLVVEVTDGILELKLAIVLDLKCSLHLVAELHWAEVEVAKR